MRLLAEKCIGCGLCLAYCPVEAISMVDKVARIEESLCTECGTCARPGVVRCPGDCFVDDAEAYQWPRSIRKFFSDPMATHAQTSVPGRGTEESKTNDVTGRVPPGYLGLGIEMGRPVIGVWGRDTEIMTRRLAAAGVRFEPNNPLYHLMEDPCKGVCTEAFREAHLISCIIEFNVSEDQLGHILATIKEVGKSLETVFALDLVIPLGDRSLSSVLAQLRNCGIRPRPNAKVNLGLGRPLCQESNTCMEDCP